MNKKGSLGIWTLPVLCFLATLLFFLFAHNENAAWSNMKRIWEEGISTEASVELLGDVSQRFSIRFDYTVDGKDYSVRTTLRPEEFARIDGEDQDGKGVAEAHYDPGNPGSAVLEGSADCQADIADQRMATAKTLFTVSMVVLVSAAAYKLLSSKKKRI